MLFITGCINYTQETRIFPDGSGVMKIHYWMNLPDSESVKVIDNIGIFERIQYVQNLILPLSK
jgi:hypothetical protein